MKKKILFFFILVSIKVFAVDAVSTTSGVPEYPPPSAQQYPAVRPKPPEDPNKESSSFIGDPENLDPLRSRRENLKDDSEPVLDDIMQVLDAPSDATDSQQNNIQNKNSPKKISQKKAPQKKTQTKTKKKKKQNHFELSDDEPDNRIERKFYQNYITYNQSPTSTEAWSAATNGRNSEVYVVQKGDTLWTISETLFGDSLFWPKIWAINRQGILNPHFITPGMQVYFYPGSFENTPTLALGDGDQKNKTDSVSQTLELQPSEGPTELPDSMPVYRSGLYYGKARKIEMIDLEEPEKIPLTYSTDILIADRLVLSDIQIEAAGNSTLSCFQGEMIENFSFIRRVKTKEYAIFQPLEKIKLDQGEFLYPYQRIGTVITYDNGKLKIKECHSYLNKDQIFVPTAIIDGLKTKKTSVSSAQILGGPTVIDQKLFAPSQAIYVDMGNANFEVGQQFEIKSRRIDQNVGQIKILDRFGSYAVAVITDIKNSVQKGDAVIVK